VNRKDAKSAELPEMGFGTMNGMVSCESATELAGLGDVGGFDEATGSELVTEFSWVNGTELLNSFDELNWFEPVTG
jgi:hypothetical protein